jgi:hypothetical protein
LEGNFTQQLEKPYLISNQITKDQEMGEVSTFLSREDQNHKFRLLNENLLIRNKSQDDLPYGLENNFVPSNRYGKSNKIKVQKAGQSNEEKLNKWLFKTEYQNKMVDIIENRVPPPE